MDSPGCPLCGRGGLLPSPEEALEMAAAMPAPPSLRAGAALYAGRLAVCGVCEALCAGVLCAHCGCYVQIRAIPIRGRCPHPAGDRWGAG